MSFTLPTKAQWLDIAKRSLVTFISVFIPTFAAAAAEQHYALAALGGIALASAAAAVNVVIRTIWKPELVKIEQQVIPVFPIEVLPPGVPATKEGQIETPPNPPNQA